MDCRVLLGLLIHEGEALGVEPKHLGIVMIFFRWCCVFVLSLILWKKGTCIFADWKILQAACTLFGSHRYDIQALAPTPLQPSLYSMHCLFSNLKDSEWGRLPAPWTGSTAWNQTLEDNGAPLWLPRSATGWHCGSMQVRAVGHLSFVLKGHLSLTGNLAPFEFECAKWFGKYFTYVWK